MKTLLSIAFAALSMPIAAQSSDHQLVLTTASGQQVVYPMSENPVFDFMSGKCVVKGDTYEFSDIAKIQADVTVDGIEAVTAPPATFEGGRITVAGTVAAALYTADGKQLTARGSTADGRTTIDTSSLQPGAYILKMGKQSMKFVKR